MIAKRMIVLSALSLAGAAGNAHAQSTEEAYKQLQQRQQERAAAATRPANQAEYEKLVVEYNRLRLENAALKKEVETLRAASRTAEAKAAADKAAQAKPQVAGGLSANNDRVVATLTSQRWLTDNDQPRVAEMKKALAERDAEIAAYLASHAVPDGVRQAALGGEPAPGMPEELLGLIGYHEVRWEGQRSKSVRFWTYGHAWDEWDILIDDGKVDSQSKVPGSYGRFRAMTPPKQK